MRANLKYIVVVGARPNFIKVAPLCKALLDRVDQYPDLEVILVHTGQHYSANMSGTFFRDLGIPEPDINLEVGSGSHAEQTGKVMIAFEQVCLLHKPDCVIVVGDVNSTLACALTAKKLGICVAHVEAGLRSRDMSMPEEINRLCTDAIADLLFTTDTSAGENLLSEGVAREKIHFVGNTMIDTLRKQIDQALSIPLPDQLKAREYAVLTLHRPANVDSPEVLGRLMGAVNTIARRMPVVFPMHPRTRSRLSDIEVDANIRIVEPMSYLPFLGLVAQARMVLTDSGGIQEETTVLGVPCLTMRENTERPITCEMGTNRLVGCDPEMILKEATAVLDGETHAGQVPDKWDGGAADRIVDILMERSCQTKSRAFPLA